MNKYLAVLCLSLLMGCGSSNIISTPIENVDTSPIKVQELS
jgi:hypothetical protein